MVSVVKGENRNYFQLILGCPGNHFLIGRKPSGVLLGWKEETSGLPL